jgi:hypothetical protein
MKSGVKLNLMIATKVLGWIIWEEKRGEYKYVVFQKPGEHEPYKRQQKWEAIKDKYKQIGINDVDPMRHIICGLKNWSTDISAAWEIVERMVQNWRDFNIGLHHQKWSLGWNFTDYVEDMNSAPEAICKAALLAAEGCK